VQWEDFKQHTAIAILDRYRDVIPSFNDDIQGTAAVVVAGVLAGLRHLGAKASEQRFVFAGAGAAAIGIARLVRLVLREEGCDETTIERSLVLLDSKGLLSRQRAGIEADKLEFALPDAYLAECGLAGGSDLASVVRAIRPTVLIGTTGTAGVFTEEVVRAVGEATAVPLIFPLSNPTSKTEATPAQVLEWTDGRALVATGSPFAPVETAGGVRIIGQANNAFIFPGFGLGAMVSGARHINDGQFLVAAKALAALVAPERLSAGALYPPIGQLREVSRAIALATVKAFGTIDGVPIPPGADADAAVEEAVDADMWWPDYQPYEPA
jgi:malate dehydrogenase (oxaloacetate-decarboxylating)